MAEMMLLNKEREILQDGDCNSVQSTPRGSISSQRGSMSSHRGSVVSTSETDSLLSSPKTGESQSQTDSKSGMTMKQALQYSVDPLLDKMESNHSSIPGLTLHSLHQNNPTAKNSEEVFNLLPIEREACLTSDEHSSISHPSLDYGESHYSLHGNTPISDHASNLPSVHKVPTGDINGYSSRDIISLCDDMERSINGLPLPNNTDWSSSDNWDSPVKSNDSLLNSSVEDSLSNSESESDKTPGLPRINRVSTYQETGKQRIGDLGKFAKFSGTNLDKPGCNRMRELEVPSSLDTG